MKLSFGNVARAFDRWSKTHYAHRIIFHHVPKCGGSSVTQGFRMRSLFSFPRIVESATLQTTIYEEPEGFVDLHEASFRFKRQLSEYYAYQDYALIQGHLPYTVPPPGSRLESYSPVTVLREPLVRFLSHYYWDLGRENQNRIGVELEAFLDTEQARAHGSMMTRYLAGVPWNSLPDEEFLARALENAERFAVVGFLDDLEDFNSKIKAAFGWGLRIPRTNVGDHGSSYDGYLSDPAMRTKIEDVCALDIQLYDSLQSSA